MTSVATHQEPREGAISLVGVSKSFPGARVLTSVNMEIRTGSIHGLVGHNGSGKSTLIKIVAGYHSADEGHVVINGEGPTAFSDLAGRDRVRVMHQDLGIVGSLSVVENLCLARGFEHTRLGIVNWSAERAKAREMLGSLGLSLDVTSRTDRLTAAEQTFVALARTLQHWEPAGGLLILDEPTASLTKADSDRLMEAVGSVVSQGAAALFVSHKLDEVLQHCESITVLQGGRVTADRSAEGLDRAHLVDLIVGAHVDERSHRPPTSSSGAEVLEVRGLAGPDLAPLSLSVRAGEVVGIAGLQGSGREEVASLLVGGLPRTAGRVKIAGQELSAVPASAARRGVALVPADRRRLGVVLSLSVGQNIGFSDVGRRAPMWTSRRQVTKAALPWVARVDLHPRDPGALVGQLSGGNQQKVVLARCLRREPVLLVLDEPSQGIDVAAKAMIYDQVRQAALDGAAVLITSSDSDELAELCHRVLVLKGGHLREQLAGDDVSSRAIDKACIA
jgi:ribose transport system ATP-binding protein